MAPNRWITDLESIDLLNYLIKETENVELPVEIKQLSREFKEKSRAAQTVECISMRINKIRTKIHSFEHIETDTKVRMLFVLSVPVNRDFLKKLSNNAHVVVDGNNRITHYKSESLELNGNHKLWTPSDTKHYWKTDIECIELLNYLIEETENVKSPMNVAQLARDFKEKSGTFQTVKSLEQRILQVRHIIHSFDHIDQNTKVKLSFALSAPVNAEFLEELKKCAIVGVDKMNRITYYIAINGGLELRGDHSQAAKMLKAHLQSRRSMSYFENKDYVVPKTGDEEELQLDYDMNCSIDEQFKLEPFRGSIQEDLNEFKGDEDIKQIPKPPQALDEHYQSEEVPIKIEVEEPVEVKPETSHNSKVKIFEAMHSLTVCLDTPVVEYLPKR